MHKNILKLVLICLSVFVKTHSAEQLNTVDQNEFIGLTVIFKIQQIQELERESQEQIKFEKNVRRIALEQEYAYILQQMALVRHTKKTIDGESQLIHDQLPGKSAGNYIQQCCHFISSCIVLDYLSASYMSCCAKEKEIEVLLKNNRYNSLNAQRMKRD